MRIDGVQGLFDKIRADYEAAKTGRFRRRRQGLALGGSSADYHVRNESDYLRIMEYARDIDRNDIVVGQGVNRLVDLVLMDGIKLDPQTGDKALDDELYARWETWAEDPEQCHVTGENNLATLVRLALRHVIVDGDVLFVPIDDGSIEPIEAHRIRTPRGTKRNVVNGVLLDERRRRLEYWVTKDDIDPMRPVNLVKDITPYPVRDENGNRQVFHLYLPRRLSQTRGVSALAPVVTATGLHDDVQFAKLVQQQVVSCFAILRNRAPDFRPDGADQVMGESRSEPLADGRARRIEGLGPGMDVPSAPGETISGFSPGVPNPEFFEHAMMILTFIAVNLNLPVLVLLLDPRSSNFSGWRGAMDQARVTFLELQRWIAAQLLCPLYRWKLRQWLYEDAALAAQAEVLGDVFFRHRWNPPRWPYIEPLKDAQADDLRVAKRLISPRRLQAEHGNEWEQLCDELVDDNAYLVVRAKTRAADVNKLFSEDPVTWRDMINLDAKAAPVPPPAQEKSDEGKDEEEEEKSVPAGGRLNGVH